MAARGMQNAMSATIGISCRLRILWLSWEEMERNQAYQLTHHLRARGCGDDPKRCGTRLSRPKFSHLWMACTLHDVGGAGAGSTDDYSRVFPVPESMRLRSSTLTTTMTLEGGSRC